MTRVLTVRNAHSALAIGVAHITSGRGISTRSSRNGQVQQADGPVITEYLRPCERVCFWPERDANPFFHLYESLWMLQGRDDLAPLTRYVQTFGQFSDDGETLHGAYGYRWRKAFDEDQLESIVELLKRNHLERRAVLQMWDATTDLGADLKDLPCNTMATFQVAPDGRLDLTVFCRSNDIVWGAYGANAVHFSVLLEYMAAFVGVPVGIYRQVSVNWHAYPKTLEPVLQLGQQTNWTNPYDDGHIFSPDQDAFTVLPMVVPGTSMLDWDAELSQLMHAIDNNQVCGTLTQPFLRMALTVLRAHWAYVNNIGKERFECAEAELLGAGERNDWVAASLQWVRRRRKSWAERAGE